MIQLVEIAGVLAAKLCIENITAGCIDASRDDSYGVYQRAPFVPRQCIGGKSSYDMLKIRILLHSTPDPTATEHKAHTLSEALTAISNEPTEHHIILWAEPKGINPIGKDEKGVYEIIVDADIFYTKKKED